MIDTGNNIGKVLHDAFLNLKAQQIQRNRIGPGKPHCLSISRQPHGYSGEEIRLMNKHNGVGRPVK